MFVATLDVAKRGPKPRADVASTVRVEFRLTPDEKAIVEHAARLNFQHVADYVRMFVLPAAEDDVKALAHRRVGERRVAQADIAVQRRSGRDRRRRQETDDGY